jgi:hypothetical protein
VYNFLNPGLTAGVFLFLGSEKMASAECLVNLAIGAVVVVFALLALGTALMERDK